MMAAGSGWLLQNEFSHWQWLVTSIFSLRYIEGLSKVHCIFAVSVMILCPYVVCIVDLFLQKQVVIETLIAIFF